MAEDQTIKHRPDGSIDTDHYMQVGRRLRSEKALGLLTGGARGDGRSGRPAPGRFRLI
jgi:hypothetical protein